MKNDKNKVEEEIETEEQQEIKEAFVKKEEFDSLKELADQIENNYKRAIADYHNLQKRVQEEKSEWIRSANKDLLLRLLPVLDTLMLASNHLKDQGLTVSINQFLDILKGEGVIQIKTVGEEFNPHLMECITTEEGEEGKVLEELRAGYLLYDKVLRPAQVKVGKK
ncbi:MAG TPA: nucleotide exchange factor GrpE [Methylomirabilota bacterium]|nr:nucleotide exchange factor GrpE [Methylomirabilota bacterium]